MFKKALFLAALSGAIISTGALTTAAQAHTLNTTVSTTTEAAPVEAPAAVAPKIFNLSSLDDTQRDLVTAALAAFDYNWAQMKPALKAKTGKTSIPIKVVDIAAKWNACGLSWPNGLIEIDDQVTDATWFQQVVVHEIGHMIDFFHLTPAKLHGKIAKIYGAPWSEIGHDFVNVVLEVASSNVDGAQATALTEAKELELRALLGGN